jgi:tetratricopeptide (TPR) repeat protein
MRDDLTVEWVLLHNLLGQPGEALHILMNHSFHPWEGGEGKVAAQYVASRIELAKRALAEGNYEDAINQLEQALVYPAHLGEGKLAGARDNHIHYFLGEIYRLAGASEQATVCFEKATLGTLEPTSPMYYNDQPPEMIFYQGMARNALGRLEEADAIFRSLVAYGQNHIDDEIQMDYFAVSLPDFLVFDTDLQERNRVHCHFVIGLGLLGQGKLADALREFDAALAQQPDHLGALVHRAWRESPNGRASSTIHA